MKKEISVEELVRRYRASTYIREVEFGKISSFNFTRKAFYNQAWNELTTTARGMFINTRTNQVVARGYNKFFNIDENQNNRRSVLKKQLSFPVSAYVKENGFLGLISYDEETDELRFATKSRLDGEYVDMLRRCFYLSGANEDALKHILYQRDATLVVEVIDPEHDPHIIKYDKAGIIALDLIENRLQMHKLSYPYLFDLCKHTLNIPCKMLYKTYDTWEELEHEIDLWLSEEWTINGNRIEGFVLCDQNGYMFKVKTGFYTKWKKYRKLLNDLLLGKNMIEENSFIKWLNPLVKQNVLSGNESIIQLREMYEEEYV